MNANFIHMSDEQLENFASAVKATAATVAKKHTLGFISLVWARGYRFMTLAQFKAHLHTCSQKGLLCLNRCDMLHLFPANIIQESTSANMHHSVHYIRA